MFTFHDSPARKNAGTGGDAGVRERPYPRVQIVTPLGEIPKCSRFMLLKTQNLLEHGIREVM